MNTMPEITFTVAPRTAGNGFNLSGGKITDPLWFPSIKLVESYARYCGRGHNCELHVLNEQGEVTEKRPVEFVADPFVK